MKSSPVAASNAHHRAHEVMQAGDDSDLLKLMMEDLYAAPKEFWPTNYWAVYEKKFLPELYSGGLVDFRQRENAVFRSFGAVDFTPPIASIEIEASRLFRNPIARRIPGTPRIAKYLQKFLSRYIRTTDHLDLDALVCLAHAYAVVQAQGSAARPLSSISMSLVGNPRGTVEIDGNVYSRLFIRYYLQYVYVSRFIDLANLATVVELGGGMGRQTEILRKLHPELSFLIFDIPPQLYVAEQYLSAVFPGDVVSYRQTRDMTEVKNLEPGKIYVFGNSKFPLLENISIDLFWNSASFHEMEPDVVQNYLGAVNRAAQWVYLCQQMRGQKQATKLGEFGVLQPTTYEHYLEFLLDFEVVDRSAALRITGKPLKEDNLMMRRRITP